MPAKNKINVKERLTDGEVDLSMSDLEDVPVKEIAQLKKVYSLDLSNNRLASLPNNFSTLTHITKLDLSKNELQSLPEDIGNLVKLRYLDLYRNQLQHLPLSFSKLTELRWLDLKDNPLVPTVAKIAGPCLNTKQCQDCAKDVVNFYMKLEKQVNAELEMRNKQRQRQLEINQKKKQEEKKQKKKEKQKLKQQHNSLPQKSETNNQSKVKKDKKNTKAAKRRRTFSSFLFKLFYLLLIAIIGIFISTSVKLRFTENVELLIKGLYSNYTDKLPSQYKIYTTNFGTFVGDIHAKTGNTSLLVIEWLIKKNSQIPYQDAINTVRNIWDGFLKKISQIEYQGILNNIKDVWETCLRRAFNIYNSFVHKN